MFRKGMRRRIRIALISVIVLIIASLAGACLEILLERAKQIQGGNMESRSNVIWNEKRVFPEFAEPDVLYVVDLRHTDFYNSFKHLPLITLQGLVNREKPRIFVVLTNTDYEWMTEISKFKNITLKRASLDTVMEMFSHYAKGYIIYDDAIPDTVNVATTMAGIYDGIVVHPNDVKWVEKFKIPKLKDLRGLFKDRYEAYQWAYENLWPLCDHRMLVPMSPGPPVCTHNPMQVAARDYVVALKLFVHYLNPQISRELDLFVNLLKDMPDNVPILGWYEEDEGKTVELASTYKKFVVVMTHHYGPLSFANPTVWSGIKFGPEPRFEQPPLRLEKLGYKKIYVTFYITDGDNLQWDINMKSFWDDPNRGKVPIAWTISPFLLDVSPLMVRYFAETMSPNDTFISGPSGAGYWYPRVNPGYIKEYLEITKRYFERTNLKHVEIIGFTDDAANVYAETLDIIAIKKEYFPEIGQESYYLDNVATPILVGTLHYKDSEKDKFINDLKKIKRYAKRPLFILVVSQPWDFKDLSTISSVVEEISKDEEFVLVNLHEFSTLLNPKCSLDYAKSLLEKAKKAGVSGELVINAEKSLEKSMEYYNKKEWWLAAFHANEALGYIRQIYSLHKIE